MKRLLFLALGVAASAPVWAEAAFPPADRDGLLALLDEQTRIATKTRMNADYVPGIITVLHGYDLEARGVRTVWEALALVPGIELAMESTGRRKALVRGVGNTWASGNLKVLLNDVSVNSAQLGLADPVFNMPVQQVERIEVIRGPGSALHGEYAYVGVVNVITRSDSNRVYAFRGSNNLAGAGANSVLLTTESGWHGALSVAGWRTDGAGVQAGPDALYGAGLSSLSYAPGPANDALDQGAAQLRLEHGSFALFAHWTESATGDHFGINNFLPPPSTALTERNRHRGIEARQAVEMAVDWSAELVLGSQDAQTERHNAFVGPAEYFGGNATGADVRLNSNYREQRNYASLDLTWEGMPRHEWLLGTAFSQVTVEGSETAMNMDPVTWAVTSTMQPQSFGIPQGTQREIRSITVQDQYRHSDVFTLTAGARHDDYSDGGTRLTPRLAGVWRLNEHHILKAQYAAAYRPPTFYEINAARIAGITVKPATIATLEAGYIFKGMQLDARVTGFYSQLDDLVIFQQGTGSTGFGNDGARLWGLELEQTYRASERLQLDGNLSLVHTADVTTGDPFPGAADWIANLGLQYQPLPNLRLLLQGHAISGYHREASDTRPRAAGYTTTDLTLSWGREERKEWGLRAGIKNLFDQDIRYPAPLVDEGGLVPGYVEDYPRPGREWWLQVSVWL